MEIENQINEIVNEIISDVCDNEKKKFKNIWNMLKFERHIYQKWHDIVINFIYYWINLWTFQKDYIVHKDNGNSVVKSNLQILDNAISICDSTIPYENIIRFGVKENSLILLVLAKFNKNSKRLYNYNQETQLNFSAKDNITANNIHNLIYKNMMFHLKYNDVNTDVLEYYNFNIQTKKMLVKPKSA